MGGSTDASLLFVYMTVGTLIVTIVVGRPLQHNKIHGPCSDPGHVCRGGTRPGRIAGGFRAGNAKIHPPHVDERAPRPPLTDDPKFLADLSDLDQGVIDPAAEAGSHPPTPLAPFPGQSPRRRLTPEASKALAAASEALAAFDPPVDSSVSSAAAFGRGTPPVAVDRKARDPAALSDVETSPASSWRSRVLLAVLMIGLMLAGAATAGWIFRGPLGRAIVRWHVVR
jgi:hypothetical protein